MPTTAAADTRERRGGGWAGGWGRRITPGEERNENSENKLRTVLVSIVEPGSGPGEAQAFHRWYERDHFYAGCMMGENYFSGRRWVATKPLKALRFPADTPITPDISRGSYLVTYWILEGTYE